MPPLASPFAYEVDRAIERAYIPPQAAGAWATIHALRPDETVAAFRDGRGPLTGFLKTLDVGTSVSTVVSGTNVIAVSPVGLGALASALGASAGAWRLP